MPETSIENEAPKEQPRLPWEIGVFDAHCHPTDTMTSISDIPHMQAMALTIMSTRGEDQELVDEVAQRLGDYQNIADKGSNGKIVPCFGWHPWFAHQISVLNDDTPTPDEEATEAARKIQHYQRVLTGLTESGRDESNDNAFFETLPTPKPLSTLLAETRKRLLAHPNALVGEIGLDRAFRLPMPWQEEELEVRNAELTPGSREGRSLSPYKVAIAHQKALLKAQLQLAGQLRRAVSVHSVQAHGAVFDVLQELWKGHERTKETKRQRKARARDERDEFLANEDDHKEKEEGKGKEQHKAHGQQQKIESRGEKEEGDATKFPLPYPPRICMHSYSGTAEALKQFLLPKVPSDVYFSFSTAINFTGPSPEKVLAALQALPDDRILVESDLHCAGEQMDGLLEEVVRTVCRERGWSLEDGTRKLAENWKRFVFG
ncbi:hypothetical protein UA08_05412 [Talaromyces atroroseus]|uniref:Cut9-interacting protein scn1 n=1 Tax=Talaromyces atroroseus TaxID=1441469 RepID=A0A225ADM9_TALAT|nr:hypothetical protein UA08_05412 [Talaromyces atroroseus]OKL59282.1 hypothetical protein UA08_05412 [Talaromyces atroroseus]